MARCLEMFARTMFVIQIPCDLNPKLPLRARYPEKFTTTDDTAWQRSHVISSRPHRRLEEQRMLANQMPSDIIRKLYLQVRCLNTFAKTMHTVLS